MLEITASRANAYTGSPLDRASHKRDDAGFVAAALDDARSLFVPVWRSKSLVARAGEDTAAVYLTNAAARPWVEAGAPWALLGLHNGAPVFALDLSPVGDAATAPPGAEFTDLRTVAGLLPEGDASVLAHARGLMFWRARHAFCGVCAARTEPRSAGNAMACASCGAQHFPRTDPAVIMLVVRGDRCLLGHSTRFPSVTMYSTLAGFVEPGESLEEAVRREVFEETSVQVGLVRYHSSQPWPFPSSMMLGFYAEGLTEAVMVDPEELRDARWFTRDDLHRHRELGFSLPRVDSIARRLIEDWLAS